MAAAAAGHGHWSLTVDVDEFLVYPFCETRPLRALTDWLDASSLRSFSAMLLDMYPKGAMSTRSPIAKGRTRSRSPQWFDSGNYTITPQPPLREPVDSGRPARPRCSLPTTR